MRSIKRLMTGWLFCSIICCGTFLHAQEDDGEALLDEAMALKLDANSARDFDKIADLCEEAIDKGLEEGSISMAKKLWASTNLEHAKVLSAEIMSPSRDRRWKFKRQQAIDRLEQAAELDPELTDAWLLIAQLNLLEGGDKDKAKEAVDKAMENVDETDAASRSKTLLMRAQLTDDEDERMKDIAEALEIDPKNKLALRVRGRAFAAQEKYDEAIADFIELAKAEDDNPIDLLLLAEQMRRAENAEVALKALDAAIEIKDDLPATYSMRAAIHQAEGNNKAAYSDAEKAIEMNPQDIEALRTRAGIRVERDEFEDAMKDVEKILMFRGDDLQAIYLRCFIYEGMKDYDSAIKDMKMLSARTGDPGVKMTLARLYNSSGDKEKAIEIFDDLLDEAPEDSAVYRGRGDLHLGNGDHAEAVSDYRKAYELNDEDSGVLNNLAWVLATSTFDDVRDGKQAVEFAEMAAEMTEYKEAHILSTLAAAHAEAGDFEKAVEWSEKAVELADDGRQKKDLMEELESLKAGEPIRENEAEEKEEEESDDEDTDDDDEEESDGDGDDDDGDDDDGDDDDGDDDDGDDDDGDDDDGDDDDGDDDDGDDDDEDSDGI